MSDILSLNFLGYSLPEITLNKKRALINAQKLSTKLNEDNRSMLKPEFG